MFPKEEVGGRDCHRAGSHCPVRGWGLSLGLDLLDEFSLSMLIPSHETFGSLCPFPS